MQVANPMASPNIFVNEYALYLKNKRKVVMSVFLNIKQALKVPKNIHYTMCRNGLTISVLRNTIVDFCH